MYAAFPRSEYYQRVRLPPSLLSPSGWSIRLTYSACFPGQDGSGSPRCHDASISVHAVLLDPAGVSSDLRLCGRLLLPSRFSTLSASGYVTRLNRFTCVTAWTSLCLRLTHVVTFMSPRLDSRWGGSSLSGAGISPAESAGLNLAHRESLLDFAVRHELGHAFCNNVNEMDADRVAKLLEQKKPISCKREGRTNPHQQPIITTLDMLRYLRSRQ